MSNLLKTIAIVFALLSIGCSDNYQYWETRKFNIDEQLIPDSTEITLLYTSRGPHLDSKELIELGPSEDTPPMITKDYYIHLVAITVATQDTINILTATYNWIDEKDIGKKFIFLSKNDLATRITMSNTEDLSKIKNVNELKELKREKVTRDPKFDFVADNNFPSIIGRVLRKE